jgi:hypothetical protein
LTALMALALLFCLISYFWSAQSVSWQPWPSQFRYGIEIWVTRLLTVQN